MYGPSLKNVLGQITRFLQEYPREILIIQVGDLRYMPKGDADHKALIKESGLPVIVASNPLLAVCMGTGKALEVC